MDSFVNEKDFALLAQDPYTFAVLDRILRGKCELVRADHRKLILCHSEKQYPVWIWTPDGMTEEEKDEAWKMSESCRPLEEGYRINMKYELAEYFMKKAREKGVDTVYYMQMYAYDCPEPIAPEQPADGEMYKCMPEDAEEAAGLYSQFTEDIGEEPLGSERGLEKARASITENELFFWKDESGKTTACCSYKVNQCFACLGPVFTLPEYRRRHYAQQLVYLVTKRLKDKGYKPMLYTDANYAASNACYEKIGYILRGRLCTLAAANNQTGTEEG